MRTIGQGVKFVSTAGRIAAVGYLTSLAACWLLLALLQGLDGTAGLLAGLLGADAPGVATAAATATGAPVQWSLPGLGVEGRVWPVRMLLEGSPLAWLALAPVLGALVVGVLVAATDPGRRRRIRLFAATALSYAVIDTIGAVIASAMSRHGGTVLSTSPLLVLAFGSAWIAVVGPLGFILRDSFLAGTPTAEVRRRRAGVVLAAAATLLTSVVVTTSVPQRDETEGGPGGVEAQAEPAPVGSRRPGVAEAIAEIRRSSGDSFLVAEDPWRGVPSVVSLYSPLGTDVASWLRAHAGLFGIADPPGQLAKSRTQVDGYGQAHWYEQKINGVPVYAARLAVHLDPTGRYVRALSNGTQPALDVPTTTATVPAARAQSVAQSAMPGAQVVDRPKLVLLPDPPRPDTVTKATLTWQVTIANRTPGEDARWAYFVEATGAGRIVKTEQRSEPAKNRRVYDYQRRPEEPSAPVRVEGDPPTGIVDADRAYDYSGEFYDYYRQVLGRDSYNGRGGLLDMGVNARADPDEPFLNAYWTGSPDDFVVFGEGVVTRDILAHEFTHGVVEYSANLVYDEQPGALNESFADIFGESVEEFATGSANWLIGTGSALGTIRSFADPNAYDQPAHLREYEVTCSDNRGVHINSGISNKAYYILAHRIGIQKAARIFYRDLTVYMHATSGFTDARTGAIQAAWDLFGKSSQEAIEVQRAWGAVGVDGIAEAPRFICVCFAEASLHGEGLSGLDSAGLDVSAIASALLRTRDMFTSGASPALSHYSLIYNFANEDALRLLTGSADLQRKTAHAMQSLAPMLTAVGTPRGRETKATRALIDELNGLVDAYITAAEKDGASELASLLAAERSRVDTEALVGMTADQVKIYLDQITSTGTPPGVPSGRPAASVDPSVRASLAEAGHADVVVMLRDKADLRKAKTFTRHADRTAYAYRELGLTARNSQQGIRDLLARRGARFEQFWIVNAVVVHDADAALIEALALRGEVSRIRVAGAVPMPVTRVETSAQAQAQAAGEVEWGVERIRAQEVWSSAGARGENIVVANIDTGVQYDHPALAAKYRGSRPGGFFDHNYAWYDPSGTCPTAIPCDNNNHGTHVMGTMVGGTATDQIGVAPAATWVAVKGCEFNSCTDESLLRSGEWVIAPTDLQGLNPRPDLAPHIVNNSWGGNGGDPFYQEIVNSWVEAGIFPVFANGNSGPGCETSLSPGDYPAAYSAGAFDSNNNIASFSSRGSSQFGGETKPNLAAPGVAVRSAVPGNGYGIMSGTSMAAPHLSGAVALLWSAAPSLIGDIAGTRQLLDDTALDTPDLTCGGTADDNNVWGEGRLDVYSAVSFAPVGPRGSVVGVVSDSRGAPVSGATVVALGDDQTRRGTVTDGSGSYSLVLPAGSYQITAESFGFKPTTVPVTAVDQTTVRRDVVLAARPRYRVIGDVLHSGEPVPNAVVSLVGTPLPPTTTDGEGAFGFSDVPTGTYTLVFQGGGCAAPTSITVTVDWDEIVTVAAQTNKDEYGYSCTPVTEPYPTATTVLPLTGDDEAVAVPLPFTFALYGDSYSTAYVSTNGSVNFEHANPMSINSGVPSTATPNTALFPFWDDLVIDSQSSVRTGITGTAPQRRFVIEWKNATFHEDPGQRVTFAVVLTEESKATFHYGSMTGGALAYGGSATVGIEDQTGSVGLQYTRDKPILHKGLALQYQGLSMVEGVVKSALGPPIPYVTVASSAGPSITTDYAGRYRLPLPPGTHWLTFTHPDFETAFYFATVEEQGEVITLDATMYPVSNSVSGHVRDETGAPVANTPIDVYHDDFTTSVTTDADGFYQLTDVPAGGAGLWLRPPCFGFYEYEVDIIGDVVKDIVAPRYQDTFGHRCFAPPVEQIEAGTPLALTGDDATQQIALPFPVSFYGTTYSDAYVSTNGLVSFVGPHAAPPPSDDTFGLPSSWAPNGSLYAFWDDLTIDASASVRTGTTGVAPDRRFVIEWRNALIVGTNVRITVQAVLYEDGRMRFQYLNLPGDSRATGSRAGIGIENADGTSGLAPVWRYELRYRLGKLFSGLVLEFRRP